MICPPCSRGGGLADRQLRGAFKENSHSIQLARPPSIVNLGISFTLPSTADRDQYSSSIYISFASVFRSTPPRGRRPICSATASRPPMFRSTPPRGRRPFVKMTLPSASLFRSTPPRGRRPRTNRFLRGSVGFRSTPPRGRRPSGTSDRAAARRVSIHASAREATRLSTMQLRSHGSFDPRLRAGGDRHPPQMARPMVAFRSTPPRGRRPR